MPAPRPICCTPGAPWSSTDRTRASPWCRGRCTVGAPTVSRLADWACGTGVVVHSPRLLCPLAGSSAHSPYCPAVDSSTAEPTTGRHSRADSPPGWAPCRPRGCGCYPSDPPGATTPSPPACWPPLSAPPRPPSPPRRIDPAYAWATTRRWSGTRRRSGPNRREASGDTAPWPGADDAASRAWPRSYSTRRHTCTASPDPTAPSPPPAPASTGPAAPSCGSGGWTPCRCRPPP